LAKLVEKTAGNIALLSLKRQGRQKKAGAFDRARHVFQSGCFPEIWYYFVLWACRFEKASMIFVAQ